MPFQCVFILVLKKNVNQFSPLLPSIFYLKVMQHVFAFSHFRAFVGFREPNSSFKRYNNNMYLFLEHGLDFRMSRNLPKEVSF